MSKQNTTQRDPHLEELSDKVRKGESVRFVEALAVINHQECLRAEREALRNKTFIGRLRSSIRSWFRAAKGGV